MKPKVYFKTFGCRTNIFDTQVMIDSLKDFSPTLLEEESDIVVVNSCTVTNSADSSVRQYINRLSYEGKKIYFTGCGVKTQGQDLLDRGLIFGVFGQSLKEQINALLLQKESFFLEGNQNDLDKQIITNFIGKSRAFIKIQEGCNFACSYCIIPSVRGKSRSIPLSQIQEQIQRLCDMGFSEFILTGTNMGSWGREFGQDLGFLLQELCKIDRIKRLRMGSLEPSQINQSFLDAISHPIIERHLHIAIQHSSPFMLKLMKRANRFAKDRNLFSHLHSNGFALGTDFIVGHPQESQTIWQEAWENFQHLPLTHLHSFIYSPRDGTPSAKLKQDIPHALAKARKAQIQAQVERNNFDFRQSLQHKQTPLHVLIERISQTNDYYFYEGFDQFYNTIQIQSRDFYPKDSWVRIPTFQAKVDKNYAEI